MRVLLDTTYARRGATGTGVYLAKLAEALRSLDVDVVETADERRGSPAGGGAGSARNLAVDLAWTHVTLPARARAAHADLVHHPLPAASLASPCPQVVTVHDLAFERLPWAFDERFRAFAAWQHRAAARRAAAVICVSDTTARDVAARWGVPRARIVVARHGPGQEPWGDLARHGADHFLYVGDDEPRKNLGVLLAGYRLYREEVGEPLPLVLAGRARAEGAGISVEDRPDAERLAQLYARAAALVHPSLHEGFGLTPLEAMSSATPVIAARSPGVVEVCGDAVRYVDPRDPRTIARALAEVGSDGRLRRDLAERGRRRAGAYSWARAARAHLDAYTLAVAR